MEKKSNVLHLFDLDDTLWSIDSKVWIIDKRYPSEAIIKLDSKDFSLILISEVSACIMTIFFPTIHSSIFNLSCFPPKEKHILIEITLW